MREKRKVDRFDLRLRAEIIFEETEEPKGSDEYFSENISSAGVFLLTERPLPIGAKIKLALQIPVGFEQKGNNKDIMLQTSGRIVRADYRGMAVCFDSNYNVSQLNR